MHLPADHLPRVAAALAVCAHPDDESFGLGAVLAALAQQGTSVRVLCFTHGEASTLDDTARSLGEVRAEELRAAADALGVERVTLVAYPDGHLDGVPLDELTGRVDEVVAGAALLVVFDEGGITGHPDHCRATDAALASAERHQVPVLAWVLPERIASALNTEFGTTFVGRSDAEIDIVLDVDRGRQWTAIGCHASQSTDNPVLRRRLELSANEEHLRWLLPPRVRPA